MMPRTTLLWIVFALTANLHGAVPWHHPLYLANEGYWPQRVTITVENPATNVLAGEAVGLIVPDLVGSKVGSLRVCRADGVELLFDVREATGAAKHTGVLAPSDEILFPIECAAQTNTMVLIYAGNDAAWPVPDYLPGTVTNRGFASLMRVTVGELERMPLQRSATRLKLAPAFAHHAEVIARNFSDRPVTPLIRANLRQAMARLPNVPRDTAVRVVHGEGEGVSAYRIGLGADLLLAAALGPRSEVTFYLGFPPGETVAYRDGKVTMDATEFDAAARFCFDELGMNVSYTPHFFYLFGWAYPPKKLFGLEPFTPEWTSAFKEACQLS